MKILLKLFSEANQKFEWNTQTAKEKLFQLLAYAESKSVVIWHAGKNIPMEDSFEDYIGEWLSINWGGYGSAVSLENTYDYFKYQYPGDEVVDGKLKSKVNASKGLFTGVEAHFEESVSPELIEKFKAQNGVVVKKITAKTCLAVTKKGKELVAHKENEKPFFTINETKFKSLFPVVKERATGTTRKKREKLVIGYSEEEKQDSIGSDRNKFNALKKLLSSAEKEKIDSGLLLLSSLNDAYVSDLLLEGVSLKKGELCTFEITGAFSGTVKKQAFHNYAITGILHHAPENAAHCNSLKDDVTGLAIDIIDPCWLGAFKNLEKLQLTDSTGQMTSLDNLSADLSLNTIILKNCIQLADISKIADFPVTSFSFSECPNIQSLAALSGKFDREGIRVLDLSDMGKLQTLDGIEFFSKLEEISLNSCYELIQAKALLKCPELKRVKYFFLSNCTSIDGLCGSEDTNIRTVMDSWTEPQAGSNKIEEISIECKGMKDLEWLNLFPNVRKLDINCPELIDLTGLRFLPELRELEIAEASMISLAPVSALQQLEMLNLRQCNQLRELNALAELDKLQQIDISSCSQLEDISGWLSNKKRFFNDYVNSLSLSDLPQLQNLGNLKHLIALREVELDNSFNAQLLPQLAVLQSISKIKIKQKEVHLTKAPALNLIIYIEQAEKLTCSEVSVDKLILEKCSIKNLSGLSNLKGLKSLIINGCSSLESLTGTEKFDKLEVIELIKLPKLKTLKGLEKFSQLKQITLHDLPLVTELSPLVGLTELNMMDIQDCRKMEVVAKPQGQLTYQQTVKFLIKIAEHYKHSNLTSWKSKLENTSTPSATLPAKEIQKIRKLLQSRDIKELKTGITLAGSGSYLSLYEDLLSGLKYDGKTLKAGKFFTGTGPAQPYLNAAMNGILGLAAKAMPHWQSFCDQVEVLDIEMVSMDYLNIFRNLKVLKLTNTIEFSVNLVLPKLEDIYLTSRDYELRGIKEKISFRQFEACTKLKQFSSESDIIASNLDGLGKLVHLEVLTLNDIRGLKMNDLMELSTCSRLSSISIKIGHCDKVSSRNKIDSLSGIEHLTQLETITFEHAEIKDTSALSGMSWLKEIDITENNSLLEFTPPSSANKLERLRLSDCPALTRIGKCNFPSSLSFSIQNTGFESFPVLKGVKKLTDLDVTNCNNLENLNGLKDIETIEESNRLSLSGCTKLKDVSGIAHFKGITLRLEVDELPQITIPNGIVKLEAGEIKSLKNIELYGELEKLDIGSSKINNLAPLSTLKKLLFLNISKIEKLKTLKGIELLESLKTIVLIDLKNLEDISALDKLVLQKIYIQGCKKKKSDFPSHLQSAIDWQTTWGFQ